MKYNYELGKSIFKVNTSNNTVREASHINFVDEKCHMDIGAWGGVGVYIDSCITRHDLRLQFGET